MADEFETLIGGQQFNRFYEKHFNEITQKYGLHKIEIEIILFLSYSHFDTAKDISTSRFFSKAHISKAIEVLLSKNYIIRKSYKHDRRRVHLELTEKAEQVLIEIKDIRRNLIDKIYYGITREEKETIIRVAKKIINNINYELNGK